MLVGTAASYSAIIPSSVYGWKKEIDAVLTALGACWVVMHIAFTRYGHFLVFLSNLLGLLKYLAEFILRLLVKYQTGNATADKMTAKPSVKMIFKFCFSTNKLKNKTLTWQVFKILEVFWLLKAF